MSLSGFLLICITAFLTAIANVLLTKGIRVAGGGAASSFEELTKLLLTPSFLTGFLTYFIASIVWFRVLASEPVSIAYPVLVSLTFAAVTLASVLVLGESATLSKMAGLMIIFIGIVIISLG
jgi:multidrug transporter EmrE-like cation transporter